MIGELRDEGPTRSHLIIVIPVYDDWTSFGELLAGIDNVMPADRYDIDVIAVDDCSNTAPDTLELSGSISSVRVLRLTTNLGHQRAIAVGLIAAAENKLGGAVAVMDADGEDTPSELERLVEKHFECPALAVVAQRHKRSEGFSFRLFYWMYVKLFRFLTGHNINFGNFSVLPQSHVNRIVHSPHLWNHFAATLLHAKVPLCRIRTTRGSRYSGQSKMNFVSLITHGLGAVSVFSDAVFVRIFLASLVAFSLAMTAGTGVLLVRLFTDLAVPGWTTNVLGFSLLLSAQSILMPILIAFMILNNRASFLSIPREHAARLVEHNYLLITTREELNF